jgi:phage shock protein E
MAGNAVLEKIKAGAAVIDVRGPDEFADGHYPNARNIPLREIGKRVGEIGPQDKPVILYCASGARSASAAKQLRSLGFTDVLNAGGLGDMPRFESK